MRSINGLNGDLVNQINLMSNEEIINGLVIFGVECTRRESRDELCDLLYETIENASCEQMWALEIDKIDRETRERCKPRQMNDPIEIDFGIFDYA